MPDAPPAPAGLSPEQRSAFDAYVTELSQLGGTPPPAPPAAPPKVSDNDWASMTDRQRENWVSQQVGWELDQLAKLDADRRRDADLQALKEAQNKAPEPEAPPSPFQRFQKFLWGDQK